MDTFMFYHNKDKYVTDLRIEKEMKKFKLDEEKQTIYTSLKDALEKASKNCLVLNKYFINFIKGKYIYVNGLSMEERIKKIRATKKGKLSKWIHTKILGFLKTSLKSKPYLNNKRNRFNGRKVKPSTDRKILNYFKKEEGVVKEDGYDKGSLDEDAKNDEPDNNPNKKRKLEEKNF